MRTENEIRSAISALIDENKQILAAAETEKRSLTQEDLNNRSMIVAKIDDLKLELSQAQEARDNAQPKSETKEAFSLLSTIRSIVDNKQVSDEAATMIAQGREECKRAGLSFSGQIQLPVEQRGVVANDITNGLDKMNIMPALRNNSILGSLGATFLTGLSGDVELSAYSGTAVTWEGEVATAKDGAGTFSVVKYQPKRITAVLPISKKFLIQDSVGAETMLRTDIVNAVAEKLEETLLGTAAGTATQPAGLFNLVTPTASVNDYAKVVALETALEAAKVRGDIRFALSPSAKGLFKTTPTFAGGNAGIVQGKEVDGLPFESSGSIPANHLAVGRWSDYVVAQFGALDLTIDPYTLSSDGQIRLVINAYFDGKPRRNAAFKTAKTIA